VVDEINGLYLDTTTSFYQWRKKFIELQSQMSNKLGKSMEFLDKKPFAYGKVTS
jgi:hypothetical protein